MKPRLAVCALAAAYVAWRLATLPGGPLTAPDSAVYLDFSPLVSLGYPAFLRVVGAAAAIVIQPVLFGVAVAALGLEILAVTGRVIPAVAVTLASLAVPGLSDYHVSILTESLFISTLVAFAAAAARFVRRPTPGSAAALSLLCGVAGVIRTTGVALAPVVLLALVASRRRLGRRVGATVLSACLPMVMLMAGERVAAMAVHGERLTSLAGRHLFAKAAFIEAPSLPGGPAEEAAARARLDAAAPIRDLLKRAPDEVSLALTVYYETCLQGACLGESRASQTDAPHNVVLQDVAMARIRYAPAQFAALAWRNYLSLWTVFKQQHTDTAEALNTFVAANRPLPFERDTFAVEPGQALRFEPSPVVRYVQPAVQAVGLLTALLALAGLAAAALGRDLPASLAVASLLSLAAHLCLLFSAVGAAGLSRFTIGVWPVVMAGAILGVWGLAQRAISPKP